MARQQKQATSETSTSKEPVKTLFERVAGYLDTNDWSYTAFEEKKYFSSSCRIKEGTLRVIIDVFQSEDWQRVLVYSTFPVYVPEYWRAASRFFAPILAVAFGNVAPEAVLDMAEKHDAATLQ